QRIYGNVAALGARELRYGHGWAIGSWFVPIVNLLRPAHIAHDAWQASDPALGPDPENWRAGSRGRIVSVWWGAFLISSLVDRIAARHGSSTIAAAIAGDRLSMASDALDIAAAVVAILFVVKLTRRQLDAREARLADGA